MKALKIKLFAIKIILEMLNYKISKNFKLQRNKYQDPDSKYLCENLF